MKKTLIILLIFVVIIDILLCRKVILNNPKIKEMTFLLEEKNQEVLNFEQNFTNEKLNNNSFLNSNLYFFDLNRNRILAKDIFKEKYTLVLKYSELNCDDCIHAEINALRKSIKKFNKSVILLAHYQNRRDLFVYFKEYQKLGLKNIKMYLIENNSLGIKADKINMPYYFCIDSTLRMTNFFIPQKDKSKLSESYLLSTCKNFINNNSVQ